MTMEISGRRRKYDVCIPAESGSPQMLIFGSPRRTAVTFSDLFGVFARIHARNRTFAGAEGVGKPKTDSEDALITGPEMESILVLNCNDYLIYGRF